MKNLITLLIAFLAFCSTVKAQSDGAVPEYGDLSEAKGLARIYITADESKAREILVKEISKANLGLEIVGEQDNAQVVIRYGSGGGMVTYNTSVQGGALVVLVRGKEYAPQKYNPRVLWSKENTRTYTSGISFSRHPATNLAREFIKAYKKMLKSQK